MWITEPLTSNLLQAMWTFLWERARTVRFRYRKDGIWVKSCLWKQCFITVYLLTEIQQFLHRTGAVMYAAFLARPLACVVFNVRLLAKSYICCKSLWMPWDKDVENRGQACSSLHPLTSTVFVLYLLAILYNSSHTGAKGEPLPFLNRRWVTGLALPGSAHNICVPQGSIVLTILYNLPEFDRDSPSSVGR